MTKETHAKLNDLLFRMREIESGFRLDPSREGQFASRLVSQAQAMMSMHCESEYGIKLYPVELKAAEDAEVVAEIKEIVERAPKAKKKG